LKVRATNKSEPKWRATMGLWVCAPSEAQGQSPCKAPGEWAREAKPHEAVDAH